MKPMTDNSIRDRILQVIKLATKGSRADFAALVGWSFVTINNVCRLGTNNAALLADIIRAVPDIDARWLLLGEGEMVRPFALAYTESLFLHRIADTLEVSALAAKMDGEQIRRLQLSLSRGEFPDFTPDEIAALKAKKR